MNYLLDTHVFLWMLSDPGRLTDQAAKVLRDPRHVVFVSAVSAVEISIKSALGKLEAPDGLSGEIAARGLRELPLKYAHGEVMATLPGHHQDPFDRMLLAQAIAEKLVLVTHDRKLELYAGIRLLMT